MERSKEQPITEMGVEVIALESVVSTNQYAKELLANTKPTEGTVIIATEQTGGKGQGGSQWFSSAGKNLTASYVIYPNFLRADKQFYLNMAISLGVREACEEECRCEVNIKWPNDIYVGGKKLGGILIENTIVGDSLSSTIAGIGINLNESNFPDTLPNPESLHQLCGREIDRMKFLQRLNAALTKYYNQLRLQHLHFLEKAYVEALYLYQHTATFHRNGQPFKGEITGVSKDGKLLIFSNGKELRFGFKEVEYR